MGKKSNEINQQIIWKKRPSEIRNYNRTLYTTIDNNDYLRIDYNLKENLIRLYVEIDEEGGNPYYSIIKDGKITAEKNVASGRSFAFAEKFKERSKIFSTIPNREVIKLINNNYNIEISGRKLFQSDKNKRLEEIRRRYFQSDDLLTKSKSEEAGITFREIRLIDLIDLFIGIILSGAVFYLLHFDYIALGVVAAFYGIIIGLIDLIFRARPPIIFKILLFILSGFISYIYGSIIPK